MIVKDYDRITRENLMMLFLAVFSWGLDVHARICAKSRVRLFSHVPVNVRLGVRKRVQTRIGQCVCMYLHIYTYIIIISKGHVFSYYLFIRLFSSALSSYSSFPLHRLFRLLSCPVFLGPRNGCLAVVFT